jgi:hypothetical protein
VGTGSEPALVLAVGARVERGSAEYPYEELAARHDATVRPGETADEAYARFGDYKRVPPPPIF